MNPATCIGCGCDDDHACTDAFDLPCLWVRIDRPAGLGVCSECLEHVKRWDAGEREPQPISPTQPGENHGHARR